MQIVVSFIFSFFFSSHRQSISAASQRIIVDSFQQTHTLEMHTDGCGAL